MTAPPGAAGMGGAGALGAFWTFSLEFYRREGVERALLHLQRSAGADINLLLLALWRAQLGIGALDGARAGALASRLEAWRRRVTERLRAAREALRGGIAPAGEAESLRQAILALEIESERIAQAVLEDATPEAAGRKAGIAHPAAAAAGLVAALGAAREAPVGDDDRQALATLLAAACPQASAAALRRALAAFR